MHKLQANTLRGGVQGNIFGMISFELWAPQVPLMTRGTFGEVPGPRHPTVSEPRSAQNWAYNSHFLQMVLEGPGKWGTKLFLPSP